jgi:hypothetical protein
MRREGECHSCGECCQTVNMTVVRDVTLQQHGNLEELQRYLSFRGIRVVGEDEKSNQLYYSMDIQCSELTPENNVECMVVQKSRSFAIAFLKQKRILKTLKTADFVLHQFYLVILLGIKNMIKGWLSRVWVNMKQAS